jgi:Protein kinase domain
VSSTAFTLPQPELVLDRYRPLRPLGRGGSGSVWLARDERTGLDIALKIVAREGKRAPRAAREAEAASRLRHERCVRSYDFGGDEGHVYIAYEYVPGRTLRDALHHAAIGDRDAVEAAAQVLDGLAHAHARGIVHRDVKPSNVLVEDTDGISIKLLDFGLAQFDEADTLTNVGDVPGTLAYISPERLRGQEATPASDVWAVGVMLWEALAGQHPFWGVPLPQVAATIEAGAAPLESERPDLPPRLLEVIAGALAIEPEKRPQASVLAAELREGVDAPRRDRSTRRRPRARGRLHLSRPTTPAIAIAPTALEARLLPAGLAAVATVAGGSILPFWTPGLLGLLAVAAALAMIRTPRLGFALALFAPLFPLGNLSSGAALAYGAAAVVVLALGWSDARAGLAFVAGPLLALVGGLALVPLTVQPARGPVRRAAQAILAVLVAALYAGLRGWPLPFTGARVGDLGLTAVDQPEAVGQALWTTLLDNRALLICALVFGLSAALLPLARRRGRLGVSILCLGQTLLVLAAAPAIATTPIVAGSWILGGLLVLRPAR